jgi:hypothetical protein
MSRAEERRAIAAEICDDCCARPGDPCVSLKNHHLLRPIQGVHVSRILRLRKRSAVEGWAEASEGPSGLIPRTASLDPSAGGLLPEGRET